MEGLKEGEVPISYWNTCFNSSLNIRESTPLKFLSSYSTAVALSINKNSTCIRPLGRNEPHPRLAPYTHTQRASIPPYTDFQISLRTITGSWEANSLPLFQTHLSTLKWGPLSSTKLYILFHIKAGIPGIT